MWPFSRKPKTPPDAHLFKLIDELEEADFRAHSAWIWSHLHDFGNRLYEHVDEETLRPWDSSYPVPTSACCELAATLTTASGLQIDGTVSNYGDDEFNFISQAPKAFIGNGKSIRFWHGAVYQFGDESLREEMNAFYAAFELSAESAFPITYSASKQVIVGGIDGSIPGFGYYASESNDVEYIR